MAPIETIKQAIDAMEAGEFQTLCDAYLYQIGYKNIISLGTKSGTKKTTKGTPDTYFIDSNGKYTFVEYTVQKSDLTSKIIDDLSKCFDEETTKIKCEDITKVLYFHTSSNISPKQNQEIQDFAKQNGVPVELIGIDKFANILYADFKTLVKDYLGIAISTEQILTKDEFIKKYDSAPTSAPLATEFMYRQNEIEHIISAFSEVNAILLYGDPGTGKTRLAIEVAEQYSLQNDYILWIIRNKNMEIWDDLNLFFKKSAKYIIFIDDANEMGNFKTIIEFFRDRPEGFDIKLIMTVRKYAFDYVSDQLDSIIKNEKILITQLKDDEIEKMIINHFDLRNHIALDRIVKISNGNPRISFLAGKIAKETGKLSSLYNISDLYKDYYGSFLDKKNFDKELFVCAGIIAFTEKINLYTLPQLEGLLSALNLTTDEFMGEIHMLHDAEIIDVYKEKAVKYSDQCLSNFILDYVFVEKKYIVLSEFVKHFFTIDQAQTVKSINILLNHFYNPKSQQYITSEIKIVWDEFEANRPDVFEKFFHRFHTLFPTESLIIINDRIEKINPKPIDISDLRADPTYQNYTDDWLDILSSCDNVNAQPTAIELYIKYYLKCPAEYNKILSYGKMIGAIRKDNIYYNYYYTQITFVNKLIEKSEQWTNDYIKVLFLDISKSLLNVSFEQTESKSKNFVFIRGSIPYSNQFAEYRKIIWQEIISLSYDSTNSENILNIINNYGRGLEKSNTEILKYDLPYIVDILNIISKFKSLDALIAAEYIQNICKAFSVKTLELKKFFENETYQLYSLLNENYYGVENNSDNEEEKKNRIKEYIHDKGDDSLISIIDMCYQLQQINKLDWDIKESLQFAFEIAYENKEIFLEAVKYYLKNWNYSDVLYPPQIVSQLFKIINDHSVRTIIDFANKIIINNWQYAYFHELPDKLVNKQKCEDLLAFLREMSDSTIISSPNRRLNFIDKYENFDIDIFFKACSIINSKKEYSHFIVSIYFDLLFNENYIKPNDLMNKFSNHIELLISIYFTMIIDEHFDYSGKYLVAIYHDYPMIIDEYIAYYKENQKLLPHNTLERLCAFFKIENYVEAIDQIINLNGIPLTERWINSLFEYNYNASDSRLTSNIVEWMKHYISSNSNDIKKMKFLFKANSYLSPDLKIEVIKFFLSLNSDFEFFTKLIILPLSSSWSGSELPIIQSEIDFLKSLLPLFTGIHFLKHIKHIEDMINSLQQYKEQVEIEEILEQ